MHAQREIHSLFGAQAAYHSNDRGRLGAPRGEVTVLADETGVVNDLHVIRWNTGDHCFPGHVVGNDDDPIGPANGSAFEGKIGPDFPVLPRFPVQEGNPRAAKCCGDKATKHVCLVPVSLKDVYVPAPDESSEGERRPRITWEAIPHDVHCSSGKPRRPDERRRLSRALKERESRCYW